MVVYELPYILYCLKQLRLARGLTTNRQKIKTSLSLPLQYYKTDQGFLARNKSLVYFTPLLLLRGVIGSLPWLGGAESPGCNLHSLSNLKVGPVLLLKL
jgi:hypothetical protein